MKTMLCVPLVCLFLAAGTLRAQEDFDRLPPERAEKVMRWLKEHRPDWFEEVQAWAERGEERRVHETLRKFEREMGGEARKPAKDRPAEKERYERLMHWLRERDPERAEHLMRFLEEKRFDAIDREFRDAFEAMEHERPGHPHDADPKTREMADRQAELDRASMELLEAWRRAQGEEKEALRAKLRETLSQLFEVREWFRHRELERLQSEIDQMRRTLEERQANRDRIIERRLQEMVGERDRLDW